MGLALWGCAADAELGPPPQVTGSATFVSGHGTVVGARPLGLTVSAPAGTSLADIRIGASKTGSTLPSGTSFFLSGNRVMIGKPDATNDGFSPPAAGNWTLQIGCAGCNSARTTLTVSRHIAIFRAVSSRSDGAWQGGFSYNRCATFLNGSGDLVDDITADGFQSSAARFFGTRSGTSADYNVTALATDEHGLALSASQASNQRVVVYTADGTRDSGVTVAQLVDIDTSNGNWKHSVGSKVIEPLIGSGNHFWSFANYNGGAGPDCSRADDNSSREVGVRGSVSAVDANGTTNNGVAVNDCDNYYSVLCVAK